MSETNGNAAFNIDALVNMVVPFEFPFEGSVLKGTWRKYATTTPKWARDLRVEQSKRLERYIDLEKELKSARSSNNRKAQTRLIKQKESLDDEYQRASYSWLADAVVTWNAVDNDKQPIPIEAMRMDGFPLPFLVAFGQHLEESRTDKNPSSSDSSNGS